MTADIPLYVVASGAEATTVLRRLARAGWTARDGFALPEQHWDLSDARLVCHGRVTDPDGASLVLLAATRGAGVVAVVDPTTDLGQALTADLGRIGPLGAAGEPTAGIGPDRATGPVLAPEQEALLDRLARGETIAAAATAEYLSLRTANRRIAEARQALGVRTTREAVLEYLRLRRER